MGTLGGMLEPWEVAALLPSGFLGVVLGHDRTQIFDQIAPWYNSRLYSMHCINHLKLVSSLTTCGGGLTFGRRHKHVRLAVPWEPPGGFSGYKFQVLRVRNHILLPRYQKA